MFKYILVVIINVIAGETYQGEVYEYTCPVCASSSTWYVKFTNFNSIHVHVNRYWSKVNLGTCDLINIHVVVAVGVVVVVL